MSRSRTLLSPISLLALLAVLLTACGSPSPTTTSGTTTGPAAGEAAATTEAPTTAAEPAGETTPETATAAEATAATAAPAGGAQGTLTVALTTNPNSLDIPATSEINAAMAAWQMYDSLVWIDDTGKIVPALAESWETSQDGTEYTFKLRDGVTFHNGEPFTADSVVLSWQRGSKPEMKFSDRWTIVKSVEKVDDRTVRMKTEKPNPLLLRTIATNWAMVPPKYIAEVGENGFTEKPVGTGAFMFEEWVKDDRIVMTANPNYWQPGLPKVERLVFRPIPESSTRVAAIQTGEVDIVTRLSAEEAQSLEGNPKVKVVRYPVDRVYYITFNNLTSGRGQPTENVKVRQAMNYAVDRQAIIDSLFKGVGKLSTGFVTPTNLELMESGKFWDLEGKKELPPLFGDSWSEASGEAYPRLRGALAGNDAPFSSWSDPQIDDFLTKISSTLDDQQRAEHYRQLQQYMHDNPPFIYLYEPETFEAINPRVQNYKPRSNEMKYLRETSVTE